jgi:Leucine-rich repeat (LRR) protein
LFRNNRSWWEKTTNKWFGGRVGGVQFTDTQVSDLSPLSELKNLRYLLLSNTQVSDLSPLAELKNLYYLQLGGTQVSDLSPLVELKNLTHLDLRNTLVSEEQVEELRQALPNCEINYSPRVEE